MTTMKNRMMKVGLGVVAAGAVALASGNAHAGASPWWNLPGKAGIFFNPATDASAWSDGGYGRMSHTAAQWNLLDFPVMIPSNHGSSPGAILGAIYGNNYSGAGSFCGQQVAQGEDGSAVVSPFICAPSGANMTYFQTISLTTGVMYSAYIQGYAYGTARIDLVTFAWLNNPYVVN